MALTAPAPATPETPRPGHASDPGILIVSPIPVARSAGQAWLTLDLWARDVNTQAALIPVTLACPVAAAPSGTTAALDARIGVVGPEPGALEDAVRAARYVQLPGNSGWRGSRAARRVLALALRYRKPVFLGISSNRARTAVLNSRNQNLLRRARALWRYADIRFTQRWLARRASGVFVVGAGLVPLVRGANAQVHVGIASWISEADIRARNDEATPRLRVCMAGRLEAMKGFHIGIAALSPLKDTVPMEMTLIGSGPEEAHLRAQAQKALPQLRFLQPVAYPGPFFDLLDAQDLVLLTNLNDEQPRLIFDAICRGAIPVCPDTPAYAELGLDTRLRYRQGDAAALADRVRCLADAQLRQSLRAGLLPLVRRHTLKAMHQERLAWMATVATPGLAPAAAH